VSSPQAGVTVENGRRRRPGRRPEDRRGRRPGRPGGRAGLVQVPVGDRGPLDGQVEPVTVTVTGPGVGRTALAHLQLRATPMPRPWWSSTTGGSGTLADNVEVVLGDGAQLTLVGESNDWADDGVHVGAQHMLVGRDATLRATTVSWAVTRSGSARWCATPAPVGTPSWPG